MNVNYIVLKRGGIPPGGVDRTVEATKSTSVDLDADGTIIGVEVTGDGDWLVGLAVLAMQGRLRVAPACRSDSTV